MLPKVSVGIGLMVICIVSFVEVQGPIGSLVVSTSATEPLEISAELGVYVLVRDPVFEKVPDPRVDQVALVADPPIVPSSETTAPAQIALSFPALTNGVAFKLIVVWSFTVGHGAIIPFAVKVKFIDPVAPEGGMKVAFNVFGFG